MKNEMPACLAYYSTNIRVEWCVFAFSTIRIDLLVLIVEPSLSTPEEKLFLRCSLIVAKTHWLHLSFMEEPLFPSDRAPCRDL